MTLKADTQSTHRFRGRDAKRNFILQQGLSEPVAETCPLQYSALLFQPRVIGLWLVVAVIMQKPSWFFALAALLWWSALAPRLNPFDALYNWTLARRGWSYSYTDSGAPQVCSGSGRTVRAGDWSFTRSGLAHDCTRY
jgi:hypothetical protein